ncbi:MAG: sigma-54-dependent Fis family transcriptional regulator, partial [Bacteroidetes bacterium]|nr:sigma-54-dependent Fis family transcriptional regulator [Bacteroidota bacterium]
KGYCWPGNVRELENLTQRLVVIVDGDRIKTTDLPDSMRFNASVGVDANQSLDQVIFQHISNVLTNVKNNKTQAAKILGIDRKTLNSKLKKGSVNENQ